MPNCTGLRRMASDGATVRLNSLLKAILRAEALAAQTSVSALLRAWIDERLDLPVIHGTDNQPPTTG